MNSKTNKTVGLFPPLLKYWRGKKGYSQLDLGLAADVSARHISFLENGRAKPSREMVLTLASTLDVPLREQNTLLNAAGFEANFEEPAVGRSKMIDRVIERMLKKHEPYPMVVMNSTYDLLNSNLIAQKLLQMFIADPSAFRFPFNMYEALFDPKLVRPFIKDWEIFARTLLARIHRESIQNAHDSRFSELVDKLLGYPGVPAEWRIPDFSGNSEPFLVLGLQNQDYELNFISIITTFSAPQNITAEETLIETLFPVDDHTEETCYRLANLRPDS